MPSKTDSGKSIETSSRALLAFGFAWVILGGLAAAFVGAIQLSNGDVAVGFGGLAVGALVLTAGWFMRS